MQIGMLGPFEVRVGAELVDVPGARLRGVLIALALRPGQVVPKGVLVDWVWGENPPTEAGNALQRLVSRLRKVLPEGVVEGHPEGYRLRVAPEDVDAVAFEALVAKARQAGDLGALQEALGLWRGAAMQDVGLQESSAYDAAVVRLEGLRLGALEDWYDAEVRLGRGAGLVTELSDLVAAHPVRERFVAALMRALAAAGRNAEALQVFERTRQALGDELGVDPSAELSAVHVALLRGEVGRAPEERKTNLRAELSSYVGKEDDVAKVRELVAANRLTTLVGPGGAGKTRLATETARTLLSNASAPGPSEGAASGSGGASGGGALPDGVWMVELAPVGMENDVAQAVLTALKLRDGLLGDAAELEPTERFVNAFRDRDALLILDNCEHVIESAAAFAHRVLGECHRLRIIATSREALGITGEALWRVLPLTLPAADADAAMIEESAAVQLLRDRAGAVGKELRDAETMARVCRALDGMPLAIELAAARLRTMTLDQLADRLDDIFRLLTGGSRTALPRQRTLRAVIDWSWELLSQEERKVLRRLAVFAGGATLEAAERVCADDAIVEATDRRDADVEVTERASTVEPWQVEELLTALTEKSLIVADGDKYRLLGTIKEYGVQRLAEAGEDTAARHAHLAYFTDLAEQAAPYLRRREQLEWLATLAADHDNLSAAMRGAIAAQEAQQAMRLAAAAGLYWWLSGNKAEGNELVMAATRTPGEVADETRAMVYVLVVTFLNTGPGDEHHAEEWIHDAYEISQRTALVDPVLALIAPLEHMLRAPGDILSAWEPMLGSADPWVRAMGRLQLGKMRIVLGQGGFEADAQLELAVTEFRAIGERFGTSFAITELAERIAVRGEFARACEYYDEAVAVVTELGSVDDAIRMRSRQAQLYWLLGQSEAAETAMAEAQRYADRVNWPGSLAMLALSKAELARWAGDADEAHRQVRYVGQLLGDEAEQPHVSATTETLLGYLADDLGEARQHFAKACQAATTSGHAPVIATVLVGLADLALRRDQHELVVRLLAASTAVRGLPDRSLPDEARIEQAARSRLGDDQYAEAAQEGRETSWDQLVAVTLAS
ncbi:BTAD domain-containing putative transcriptional regulator [Kribbella sp. NPDC051770]|uniref:BTAD domain-containing putative transcriptional regulator n=1 Tax=Kribbella sp. NPDC051770 TaxID=3155413 RepID=UPI00342ED2A7